MRREGFSGAKRRVVRNGGFCRCPLELFEERKTAINARRNTFTPWRRLPRLNATPAIHLQLGLGPFARTCSHIYSLGRHRAPCTKQPFSIPRLSLGLFPNLGLANYCQHKTKRPQKQFFPSAIVDVVHFFFAFFFVRYLRTNQHLEILFTVLFK